MQKPKEDIRNQALATAKRLFLQKGYLKTSMREIAEASGASVGNLYNYFANKDELLRAAVRPALEAFERMLQEHHGQKGTDITVMMQSDAYFRTVVDEYISLINRHGDLIKILLFRSQGSSLEQFKETYASRSTETVKAWFADMKEKHPNMNASIPDIMIQLHTAWMFTLLEKLLTRTADQRDVQEIVRNYILFEIQGWKAITRV